MQYYFNKCDGGDFVQDVLDQQFNNKLNIVPIGDVRENKDKVVVANDLVRAGYKLSLVEKRLLLMFISRIYMANEDGTPIAKDHVGTSCSGIGGQLISADCWYALDINEYARIFDVNRASAKQYLKEGADKLFKNRMVVFNKNNTIVHPWLHSIIMFHEESNSLLIRWHEYMIPYLANLREHFSTYKLNMLLKLHSFYSLRFYELFQCELRKQYSTEYDLYVPLEDLHFMLQLEKPPVIANLMQKIVIPALEEINEKTDLNISLERIMGVKNKYNALGYRKHGRKVVGITFGISKKSKEELILQNMSNNNASDRLQQTYMEKCAEVTRITQSSEE